MPLEESRQKCSSVEAHLLPPWNAVRLRHGLSYWVVFREGLLAALFAQKKVPPPADSQPNSRTQLKGPFSGCK